MYFWRTFFFLSLLYVSLSNSEQPTDLALHYKDLLLFSTLNGTLIAVDKVTGDTVWSLKSTPPVVSHHSSSNYLYLTDPKDGSLYMSGPHSDGIKRLPLTIPELVQISPCSSTDGLLYSASKQDSWIAVDTVTGKKLYSFSSHNGLQAMCPNEDNHRVLHLPTIEYKVAVLDSTTKQLKWNITYTQYGSQAYTARQPRDLLHFSSSSDGSLTSINSLTGERMWDKHFDSPVVGVYSVESSHTLRGIPFTSLNQDTLKEITASRALAIKNGLYSLTPTDTILQSSFFVGDHKGQSYAMSALTDESNIQELPPSLPLLDGPHSHKQDRAPFGSGYYPPPEYSGVKLEHLLEKISSLGDTLDSRKSSSVEVPVQSLVVSSADAVSGSITDTFGVSLTLVFMIVATVLFSSVVASIVAVVVTRTANPSNNSVVLNSTPTPSPSNSRTGSHSSKNRSMDNNSTRGEIHEVDSAEGGVTNSSDSGSGIFKNGTFHIGKISYSTQNIIGKGSHGTIVFKGEFDSRAVAVKRVIQDYFDLADREVALLRESDQHPNVIRYFCMEEDLTFRYLALEFCSATLQEYVEGLKMQNLKLDEKHIIWQSMSGVSHLHNLGIVHRDIKPQNVLLALKSSVSSNEVRAMISDFGLCRKLPVGRGSFTAQSGVLGTEGWIAPEMFQDRTRVTCAVDIFAMGCLIYYVLSAGSHPFGTALRRQANIEAGDFSLTGLIGEDRLTAEHLVTSMISYNSKFRPSADEVLCHCLFWSKARQLAFFQDVSDRIEKESLQSPVVQALDRNASSVIKGDWREHIGEELRQDLRKFRSYQGSSVRDLLRALRNKKHHYRELPETLKSSLGHIPEGFVTYFTSRFPSLLIHTYRQMEMCKNEAVFRSYYSQNS